MILLGDIKNPSLLLYINKDDELKVYDLNTKQLYSTH